MNCPVCKNMAGIDSTELVELATEVKQDTATVEVVFECRAGGHEFIAEFVFAQYLYAAPPEGVDE
jgi:hypothetical protein